MKHTLIITALVAVSAAVLTGCANAHKNDASTAVFKPAALATAHGIGTPNVTVTDTTTASNTVSVINVRYDWHDFVGTNIADPKPLAALDVSGVAAKPVPLGSYTWSDLSKGGVNALFADPHASAVSSTKQNQATLGGSHTFATGDYASVVDTNTAAIVGAAGTAIGNVIGAAANSAAK